LTRRGRARLIAGDLAGGREDLDRALNLDGGLAEAWRARAEAKRLTKDAAGAVEDCNRALQLRPNFADALATRGQAYSALGDHKAALGDCKVAMKLNPPTLELRKSDWTHLPAYTIVNAKDADNVLDVALQGEMGDPSNSATKLKIALEKAKMSGVDEAKLEEAQKQLDAWELLATCLERMQSSDANAKKEAVKALAPLGEAMAIPHLAKLLNVETDRFVRHRAMEALAVSCDPEALPVLEAAIKKSIEMEDSAGMDIGLCAQLEIKGDRAGIEKMANERRSSWVTHSCQASLARFQDKEAAKEALNPTGDV